MQRDVLSVFIRPWDFQQTQNDLPTNGSAEWEKNYPQSGSTKCNSLNLGVRVDDSRTFATRAVVPNVKRNERMAEKGVSKEGNVGYRCTAGILKSVIEEVLNKRCFPGIGIRVPASVADVMKRQTDYLKAENTQDLDDAASYDRSEGNETDQLLCGTDDACCTSSVLCERYYNLRYTLNSTSNQADLQEDGVLCESDNVTLSWADENIWGLPTKESDFYVNKTSSRTKQRREMPIPAYSRWMWCWICRFQVVKCWQRDTTGGSQRWVQSTFTPHTIYKCTQR